MNGVPLLSVAEADRHSHLLTSADEYPAMEMVDVAPPPFGVASISSCVPKAPVEVLVLIWKVDELSPLDHHVIIDVEVLDQVGQAATVADVGNEGVNSSNAADHHVRAATGIQHVASIERLQRVVARA